MTIRTFREAGLWQRTHDALAPAPGDVAPDFELLDTRGEGALRLSEAVLERPVALIFGSFT